MNITITSNEYAEKTWERIKAARAAAESAGFLYNGVLFDSDPVSMQRITGAVSLAMLAQAAGEPFSQTWTVADNSTVELDAAGMLAVGVALGTHISAIFEKARDKRAAIALAATADELDAITW
jgi:hypothetical protein